jgi:hypothetical protein
MVVFYYKDAHGKLPFPSSARRRCIGSTIQARPSSYYRLIMANPDDKSMTKIGFCQNSNNPLAEQSPFWYADPMKTGLNEDD